MRRFLELVRENKELRRKTEEAIKRANTHMALSCSNMSDESLEVALMMPSQKMSIEIKDKNNVVTSMKDVTANPKNLVIRELDAAIIPNSLPDLTVAVINCNYALPAGLNPTKDSILLENANNPFLNIFVTREANVNDPRIKQLQEVYQSAENKKFVNEYFKGTITPAW